MTQIFTEFLNDGDVVIDAGGHIGYFTLLTSGLVGAKGKVLTFELSRKNYRRLEGHLVLNKVNNVCLHNIALGKVNEQTVFHLNIDNYGGHSLWDVSTHDFNQK